MYELPNLIHLLFGNIELDLADFMVSIYNLTGKSKNITLETYLYYYVLNKTCENPSNYSDSRFYYYKELNNVSKVVIYLYNVGYIKVENENFKKLLNIKISLTDSGKKFVTELRDKYYLNLSQKYQCLKVSRPYNKTSFNHLLEEINERYSNKEIEN